MEIEKKARELIKNGYPNSSISLSAKELIYLIELIPYHSNNVDKYESCNDSD